MSYVSGNSGTLWHKGTILYTSGYTCTWHIYIGLFTTNYPTDRNSWEHFECIGEILSS